MSKKYTFLKNSIPEQLQKALKEILKTTFDTDCDYEEIHIEEPNDRSHGDYSTNIAMTLTKELKRNPREIAEQIIGDWKLDVATCEIAGPGFINFVIRKEDLITKLNTIIKEDFSELNHLNGLKVILEFTDPNPFKEFHIGHLYSNTMGESISRLYETIGAEVKRANYFGDVGMHVSKTLWGLQKRFKEENITIDNLETKELPERIKYLGEAYAMGASAYKEDEVAKEKMKDINYMVFVAGQEYLKENYNWTPQVDYRKFIEGSTLDFDEIKNMYFKGKSWTLEYFETIYKILGTKFDFYYPESRAGEIGFQIVEKGLKDGIFEQSDQAVIFDGEKHGLHTRVFINSLGLPTYEAKELGLAPTKYEEFKYDKSIIITANEINEYFKVLLKTLEQTSPELAKKTEHIGHGMVKLPEGKMSSRTGKIIRGKWLIDETQKRIKDVIKEGGRIEENEIDITSEKLAVSAIKYSFLKPRIGGDIIFDFGESLSFEGNSGPYIQYTFARCKSILRKAEEEKLTSTEKILNLESPEEILLSRSLIHYSERILEAALSKAPNIVVNQIHEIAQNFNLFYQKCPILKEEGEVLSRRLELTKATAIILKHGLNVLGMKTVEKM